MTSMKKLRVTKLDARAGANRPMCHKGGDEKQQETNNRGELNHWQPEHRKADGERRCQRAGGEEPSQYAKAANGVQCREEQQQVATDAAEALQRRKKHNRQAGDESPHQLIIEAKLAQRSQWGADARPAQAMVDRPRQGESEQRFQRKQ